MVEPLKAHNLPSRQAKRTLSGIAAYFCAALLVCVLTIAGMAMIDVLHFNTVSVAMTYTLGVMVVAIYTSRGPAILASLLNVAAFDFFFVSPHFTFAVADTQYFVTFAVMLTVALVITTLTSRMRNEAARALAQEREAHALLVEMEREKLRNALLSSLSHDLRTPLSTIKGAASLLAEILQTNSSSSQHTLAVSILEEAERLNRLIENLVFATKLESGAVAVKREWVSLEEIIGSALTRLRSERPSRKVRIMLAADFPLVRGDGVLLEQAILNILENAYVHGGEEREVEIKCKKEGGRVEIRISDCGPGLEAGSETRVFERFYTSRRGGAGGLGLGLHIAKGVVLAHGGKIRAENRWEGGASIFIDLVADEAPMASLQEVMAA